MCALKDVVKLINNDKFRLEAMACVSRLNLPDCYITAGFVRNMVWDHLHEKAQPTPLNDVDVIYFDTNESDPLAHLKHESVLTSLMPEVKWQVKNQAFMHVRNGDRPYTSSLDAMGFWPEKETAVAARLLDNGQMECVSAFGFGSLFQLKITHNPVRDPLIFDQRIKTKKWLEIWPMLNVVGSD